MTRRSVAWGLARKWLERSLPAQVQPEVIGDLFEDFGSHQRSGWLRAEAWVLIQAWSLARAYRSTLCADQPPTRRFDELPALFARLCRHAVRSLGREPVYAAAVIVTLAIGIGSTTAVYSVVQQALLDPLPYPNASRLVALAETRRDSEISVSYLDFEDWQRRAQSFEALALFSGTSFTLPGTDGAERVRADFIGPGLLHILGTTLALGRPFTPSEEAVGPHVVLVTYGLWRRHFGGDPHILTRRLQLDADTFAIVGVLPQGFDFPSGIVYSPADIYLPLGVFVAANPADITNRSSHPGLEAIGLLRPGVAIATARAEMTGIAGQLRAAYPGSNREVGVIVRDAVSAIVGDLRGQLVLVQAGVLLLLLLACVNAAGLALTRITSRAQQNAIAVALGAPIWHLTLAQLIELAIAAGIGGAVGCGLATMTLRLIEPLVAGLPRLDTLSVSWHMARVSVALSGLSCVACSILPALRAGKTTMQASLRQRGGAANIGIRRVLTVGQIALALVLLLGAGTLAQSLTRLMADDGGLKPDGVLTFDIRLPSNWADTRTTAFFSDLYQRLGLLPGVTAVGGISVMPFSGGGSQSDFEPVGDAPQSGVRTDVNVVTPDYFKAEGIPIRHGRGLTPMDGVGTPPVAVVDDWFATRFWPGASPIGQHVRGWGFSDLVVVGVVGHVKSYGSTAPSREELYVPMTERPRARLITALRSVNSPASLAGAVRRTVAELDRSVAIANVETMRRLVDNTIAGPRIASLLGVTFATSALVLALVALSGLMSYLVDLRRREMGIRLALGAKPVRLVLHVMAGAAQLTVAGIVVGIPAALVLLPLARSQMPSLEPAGYLQLFLAPIGFLAVATLACWLPARRAAGVPLTTVLED